MALNGIDISNWQKGIDISALSGVDFVISKATEGTGYVSPDCDRQVQQSRKLGKLWGFYHFASGTDAKAEADFFVKHTANYFGEGIPVLDFEANAISKGASWAKAFLDRVYELTKVRPWIYMSQSVCTQFDWSAVAPYYALWVAQYPNVLRPGLDWAGNPPTKTGAFSVVACWQYASDGNVAGYSGNLDVNHYYGSRESWGLYARGDREKAPDEPELKPNDPLVIEDGEYRVTVEKK